MNTNGEQSFLEKIEERARSFLQRNVRQVVLLHHNDTDGLSSGTIVSQTVTRLGIRLLSYALEKPYPKALGMIFQGVSRPAESAVIFADFGSGMLSEIDRLNEHRMPVIVLDHHTVEKGGNSKIDVINCLEFGIPGHSDCSASSVCYFFSKAVSALNEDLAPLGVLGAVGDSMFDGAGRLSGMNRRVAEQTSRVRFLEGNYFFDGYSASGAQLKQAVDALGSYGYLKGGPDLAKKGLVEGFGWQYFEAAEELSSEFEAEYRRWLSSRPLVETELLTWFVLEPYFAGFGVKTVGLICERLMSDKKVNPDKYLAGFQRVPDTIPGLGSIALGQAKVSMRLPAPVYSRMMRGEALALSDLLPEATRRLNGFVDACHKHAGATTISAGDEQKLVSELEKILRERCFGGKVL